MNKSELIEELAERTGYSPKLTDKTVRIFFDRIKYALKVNDKVEIRGFGSFNLKKYKGYTGRNPKTGEKIKIPSKKSIHFKMSKEMFNNLNENK